MRPWSFAESGCAASVLRTLSWQRVNRARSAPCIRLAISDGSKTSEETSDSRPSNELGGPSQQMGGGD
jgi:hypothetical protein